MPDRPRAGSDPHEGGPGARASGAGGGRRPAKRKPPQVKYVVAKRADVLRGGANKQAFELICPGDVLRVHSLKVDEGGKRPRSGWALVTLYYAADAVQTPGNHDSRKGHDPAHLRSTRAFTGKSPGVGKTAPTKGWTRISVLRGETVAGYQKIAGNRFTGLNRHEPYEVWAKRVPRSSKGPNRLLEYIPCVVKADGITFLRFVGSDSGKDLAHRVISPSRAPHYPPLERGHVIAVARHRTIPRSRWLSKIGRFYDRWSQWLRQARAKRSTLPAAPPPALPPGKTQLDWFLAAYFDDLVPGLSRLPNQYTFFTRNFRANARVIRRGGEDYVAVLGRAAKSSSGECGGFGFIKLADFTPDRIVPVTTYGAAADEDKRRRYWRISGASPSANSRTSRSGVQLVYPSRAIALEFNKFIDRLFLPDGSLRGGVNLRDAVFETPIEHKKVNVSRAPGFRAKKAKPMDSRGFFAVVDYYVGHRGDEPLAK